MNTEMQAEEVRQVQIKLMKYPDLRYAVIPLENQYCDAYILCSYKEAIAKFVQTEGAFKMVKVSGYDPMYISKNFKGLSDGGYTIIQEVLMCRG